MNDELKKEIENIVYELNRNCSQYDFWDVDRFLSRIKNGGIPESMYCSNKLSKSFISEFKDNLDWMRISYFQKLSESTIRDFKDYVDWKTISMNQKLSEDFIEEFKNKVNWANISRHQSLSEQFIVLFENKVNWGYISEYQKLSDKFIEEFQDKVDWKAISWNQAMSNDFILKFKDKIDLEALLENVNVKKQLSMDLISVIFNEQSNNLSNELREIISKKITREIAIQEMKLYANTYSLKFDGKKIIAYKKWNGKAEYDNGFYYKDWYFDYLNDGNVVFGNGISNIGELKVSVSVDDWISWPNKNEPYCKVLGFTLIKKI